MKSPFKTRFAPSPTGLLHLGNVRTALFNVLLARKRRGVFLLRIEDTDIERSDHAYTEALMEDLRWLGLDWQEGPGKAAGSAGGSFLQSERLPIYRDYLRALEDRGHVYPCFCSEQELKIARKAQLASGRAPRYSGRCRNLNADDVAQKRARGESASLRFHVRPGLEVEFEDKVRGLQKFASDDIGDFVVCRSNGSPAFFFTNAVDDALMGVSLVLRGEDHLTNTPRQILLLKALDLPVPEYAHIALVVGADGTPLSKRHGSRTVRELRESGFFHKAINNYLARLGHTYPENLLMDLDTLAQKFEVERLGRAPARYDSAQLLYWQNETIARAPAEELWAWIGHEVHALVPEIKREAFIEAVRANISFPEHALMWARIIFTDQWDVSHAARAVLAQTERAFFGAALEAIEAQDADYQSLTASLKAATGAKGKALFQPLRAALTGELDGPEMARLLPLIGAERAKRRFADARSLQS